VFASHDNHQQNDNDDDGIHDYDETTTLRPFTMPASGSLTIQAECSSCRKAGRSNKVPHGMLLNLTVDLCDQDPSEGVGRKDER
jgi:hypothetical protein